MYTASDERPCEFPDFLRAKTKMGNTRIWFTETAYLTNSVNFEKQKQITVEENTILIKMLVSRKYFPGNHWLSFIQALFN